MRLKDLVEIVEGAARAERYDLVNVYRPQFLKKFKPKSVVPHITRWLDDRDFRVVKYLGKPLADELMRREDLGEEYKGKLQIRLARLRFLDHEPSKPSGVG